MKFGGTDVRLNHLNEVSFEQCFTVVHVLFLTTIFFSEKVGNVVQFQNCKPN